MSAFGDRVKKNVKQTNSKPPVVSAKTSYTDDDVKAAGSVDGLCDESSLVCLVACNYAVNSVPSKAVVLGGVSYIVSSSENVSSVVKPPKPPVNDV
jgi:hypothetical protein